MSDRKNTLVVGGCTLITSENKKSYVAPVAVYDDITMCDVNDFWALAAKSSAFEDAMTACSEALQPILIEWGKARNKAQEN